ncbi:MAG TPA: hypothetical protein PLN21_20195 [Gemmatales bacterium]|nr:hypothetical protein [Gemmatales bacterium]
MNRNPNYLAPWEAVESYAQNLVKELACEIHPEHTLWGCRFKAVARRRDCDDILFEVIKDGGSKFAVVHLPWSSGQECGEFPSTEMYSTIESWIADGMSRDHKEWEGSPE